MKIHSKIALGLLLAMPSALAFGGDQYIYWMLDQTSFQYPTTFDLVTIREEKTGEADGYAVQQDEYFRLPAGTQGVSAAEDGKSTDAYWAKIDSAYACSGASFVIELYVFDGADVRKVGSGTVGYDELTIFNEMIPITDDTTERTPFTDWKVIPEPTSGLLVLLGLAGLSLRRKRA